jgi:hypothetical protein
MPPDPVMPPVPVLLAIPPPVPVPPDPVVLLAAFPPVPEVLPLFVSLEHAQRAAVTPNRMGKAAWEDFMTSISLEGHRIQKTFVTAKNGKRGSSFGTQVFLQ